MTARLMLAALAVLTTLFWAAGIRGDVAAECEDLGLGSSPAIQSFGCHCANLSEHTWLTY